METGKERPSTFRNKLWRTGEMNASIIFKSAVGAAICLTLARDVPAQRKENPTADLLIELTTVRLSNSHIDVTACNSSA